MERDKERIQKEIMEKNLLEQAQKKAAAETKQKLEDRAKEIEKERGRVKDYGQMISQTVEFKTPKPSQIQEIKEKYKACLEQPSQPLAAAPIPEEMDLESSLQLGKEILQGPKEEKVNQTPSQTSLKSRALSKPESWQHSAQRSQHGGSSGLANVFNMQEASEGGD